MKSEKLLIVGLMVLSAIIMIIVLWIIAIIGAMNLTDGCLYRYSLNEDGSNSNSDSLTNAVTLKANGNYTALSSERTDDGIPLDPNAYGKWLNTNLRVTADQVVKFNIKGEVSLCKAYLPANNLQNLSDRNIYGERIAIPRVDDKISPPINLIFDAKTDEWRNLAEVFQNDYLVVSLLSDQKSTVSGSTVYDSINDKMLSDDCREGKQKYSPICGRYSIWGADAEYVDTCKLVTKCYECNNRSVCKGWDIKILDWCIGGWENVSDWCSCYKNANGVAPEPYLNDGTYTSPWFDNLAKLNTNFARDCGSERQYIEGEYQKKKYFWFSADNAAGLLYRFNNNINPTKTRGSKFAFARINADYSASGDEYKKMMESINSNYDYSDGQYTDSNNVYKNILNTINSTNNRGYDGDKVSYLQYRFHDNNGKFADNTGGYVLNIKQTKCRRSKGEFLDDTVKGRGAIEYTVSEFGNNPNNSEGDALNIENILVNNGTGKINVPSNQEGYLWLKIKNDPNDYQDSFGQYQVQFATDVKKFNFYDRVLDPFFQGLKGKIKNTSITMFKNMTCYKGIGGAGNCSNLFSYIKAMLILYIMLYGMMFLLGMVQISQTDLVIRVVKIAFVAGLVNESTFEFFNSYVFDFVTGFSDSIISNMSGYSLFSNSTSISNPFMFMNEVMTKIFFSSTFAAQMMAMLSMGLNGVLYFILLFVCMGIILIVSFRAIAVYLMAFMAIAVLIGLAPLFLTFILFERTWYLFENWLKFMFRYMVEPVIMLAGIIILTQLFTIYLDYVVGYSVCWKCAIPFKIPFLNIAGMLPDFLDQPLFCINWFAPWGFDHRSSQMGMNIQNMVVLLMIAYCMWGYLDFSSSIVSKLVGVATGPSATSMGQAMSSAIEQKSLSKVGLDAESRKGIKNNAKERLKTMRKGDKNSKIEGGDRHDKGRPKEKEGKKPEEKESKTDVKKSESNPKTPSSWKSAKPSLEAKDAGKSSFTIGKRDQEDNGFKKASPNGEKGSSGVTIGQARDKKIGQAPKNGDSENE